MTGSTARFSDRVANYVRYRRGHPAAELRLRGAAGRLLSSSYAPPEAQPRHSAMVEALERLFRERSRGGEVVFEYETEVYFGQGCGGDAGGARSTRFHPAALLHPRRGAR